MTRNATHRHTHCASGNRTVMGRGKTGVTAAAILPSALGAAMLIGAPLAGTTTSAPLAHTHARAAIHALPPPMKFDVPTRAIVAFAGAELMLVGVGVGVIMVARNRSAPRQRS